MAIEHDADWKAIVSRLYSTYCSLSQGKVRSADDPETIRIAVAGLVDGKTYVFLVETLRQAEEKYESAAEYLKKWRMVADLTRPLNVRDSPLLILHNSGGRIFFTTDPVRVRGMHPEFIAV